MQLTTKMRKPSITKKQASMGAGKESTMKRPQRGLGVAELERIRLQEEQEERLFYHAASSLHHYKLQAGADHSSQYSMHYQQLPFFPNQLPCSPSFSNPNPNFMHPNFTLNGGAPPTCNSSFISAQPTKPSVPPAVQPLACSPTLPASLHTEPTLMSSTHSNCTADPLDPWLPYVITAQKSPSAAVSFAAPNLAPFNLDSKIQSKKSASSTSASPNVPMELSLLPLHSSSLIQAADDSAQRYHGAPDGEFLDKLKAPFYHDQCLIFLSASPTPENPPSLTDLCPDPPPLTHGHDSLMTPKKKIPPLALQGAKEPELPSFQNMVLKTQKIINCGYEEQYEGCNFDLNSTQGEYDLTLDPKGNTRSKLVSFGGTPTFSVDTSPRDDFLKLGLPTFTKGWNQVNIQTLEHFYEYTSNPSTDLCSSKMVKGNKNSLDLELKLSLPSFGY